MKASLYHLQLNVSDFAASASFYKALLGFFEYKVLDEGESWLGMSNGTTDFWIMPVEPAHADVLFHRKNAGLNHLAFGVSSKEDVDHFYNEFLKPKDISTLYSTPKAFPEYTPNYYAVFFEDPDRLKIEVVFHGKHA